MVKKCFKTGLLFVLAAVFLEFVLIFCVSCAKDGTKTPIPIQTNNDPGYLPPNGLDNKEVEKTEKNHSKDGESADYHDPHNDGGWTKWKK